MARGKQISNGESIIGFSEEHLRQMALSGQLKDFSRICLTELQVKLVCRAASIPVEREQQFAKELTAIVNRASFDFYVRNCLRKSGSHTHKSSSKNHGLKQIVEAAVRLKKEIAAASDIAEVLVADLVIRLNRSSTASTGIKVSENGDELHISPLRELVAILEEIIPFGERQPVKRRGRQRSFPRFDGPHFARFFFMFSLLHLIRDGGGKASVNKDGVGSLVSVLKALRPSLPEKLLPTFITRNDQSLAGVREARRVCAWVATFFEEEAEPTLARVPSGRK